MIIEAMRPQAAMRKVEITVNVAPEVPNIVKLDPDRF
jgi:hypothetical protein